MYSIASSPGCEISGSPDSRTAIRQIDTRWSNKIRARFTRPPKTATITLRFIYAMSESQVTVVGAGLAGSEAAWQLARKGIAVRLVEMRPAKMTEAHQTANFAELVCSNSLRNDSMDTAVGVLKEEMRRLGSLVISAADRARVPAGSALAVDRDDFSRSITTALEQHSMVDNSRDRSSNQPGLRRSAQPPDRSAQFVFLRRDRADRVRRFDRHDGSVQSLALRQGRRRLHQLSNDRRTVRGLRRGGRGG